MLTEDHDLDVAGVATALQWIDHPPFTADVFANVQQWFTDARTTHVTDAVQHPAGSFDAQWDQQWIANSTHLIGCFAEENPYAG